MIRGRSLLALAAAAWLASGSARAEDAPKTATTTATAPLRLVVEVDRGIAAPLRARIRAAVAAELNATLVEAPAPGVGTLRVARGADGRVELSYQVSPTPVVRSVPWGADDEAALMDIALMAADLFHDQESSLLPPAAQLPPVPLPAAAAPQLAQPPVAALLDTERPPDFAPPPPPAVVVPGPPNRTRLQVVAVVGPPLALASDVEGGIASYGGTAFGLQARFDLPVADRLSLGAGFGLHDFIEPDDGYDPDTRPEVEIEWVVDASAWLRAYAPLPEPRVELYVAAGAGPSVQNEIDLEGGPGVGTAGSPGLGLGAQLLAGANMLVTPRFGLVLEAGLQYRLMRAQQLDRSWLALHALHLGVQLGALWVFDAR